MSLEYVTLDARKLADCLLALFHQSKRFYAENVKGNEKRNKVRKDQQIKMFNTKVALPLACENSRPSSLPVRVAFRKKDACDLPPKIPY